MFEIFKKNKEERGALSKNDIVQLLKTTPEALSEFEKAYINYSDFDTDNFFKLSSRQASEMNHRSKESVEPNNVRDIINRIVDELLLQTAIYDSETDSVHTYSGREDVKPVTNEEILALPEEIYLNIICMIFPEEISDFICLIDWTCGALPHIRQEPCSRDVRVLHPGSRDKNARNGLPA